MRGRFAGIMVGVVGISCAAARGSAKAPAAASASAGKSSPPPPVAAEPPALVARARLGAVTASKWRLGNGLLVVLVPDPTATSVSYMTWFRVGSRDEDEAAGQTGLAHLFEHLMFTQSAHAEVGEFDRRMEAVGGNANAMTYYDFTAYVDDLPPEELPVAVRLEADRMVNLDLRKSQVDNERDVVVEERLASVEDSVDGTLDEIMYKQAFKLHPYRWPVIGWMKDIKSITRERAVAFYRRFYAPQNAVVVVTGRFEEQAALGLIAAAYAGIPAGPAAPAADPPKPERAPAAEVRAAIERPVPADRFVVGFPAPGLADADRAAYEVVNEILTGGPSSRLYRELVVQGAQASSVRGDIAPTRDPGLYAIWIQMTKGHAAEEAERRVMAAAADLTARPVAAPELEKAKARLETELWRQLAGSHGRAESIGHFEIAAGDFRRLFARAEEYGRVTAADVQRIAATYLAPGARSVVIARPKAPKSPAQTQAKQGKQGKQAKQAKPANQDRS